MDTSWHITGKIKPQDLTESRLQLHYAIQFIAATGTALAEPLPDYSHTSLAWNPDLAVFMGAPIRAATPFRVALNPVTLTSILLDSKEETIASLALAQKTLVDGMSWHQGEISKLGADASKIEFLSYPPDDFPDHPLADGDVFPDDRYADKSSQAGRQELTNFYANSHRLLQELVDAIEDASPIHIWPHHFDMAILISLSGKKDGEPMTIGIGMSPGDVNYKEPYWYVSPYPYPNLKNLPPLDGHGFWHTEHWVGAVLTASKLTQDSAEAQEEQVRAFLRTALEASKTLLGKPS
ncbi:MAG: hypothetical protein WCA07_09465 [Gloeobacterales cyanobacterium]